MTAINLVYNLRPNTQQQFIVATVPAAWELDQNCCEHLTVLSLKNCQTHRSYCWTWLVLRWSSHQTAETLSELLLTDDPTLLPNSRQGCHAESQLTRLCGNVQHFHLV